MEGSIAQETVNSFENKWIFMEIIFYFLSSLRTIFSVSIFFFAQLALSLKTISRDLAPGLRRMVYNFCTPQMTRKGSENFYKRRVFILFYFFSRQLFTNFHRRFTHT